MHVNALHIHLYILVYQHIKEKQYEPHALLIMQSFFKFPSLNTTYNIPFSSILSVTQAQESTSYSTSYSTPIRTSHTNPTKPSTTTTQTTTTPTTTTTTTPTTAPSEYKRNDFTRRTIYTNINFVWQYALLSTN